MYFILHIIFSGFIVSRWIFIIHIIITSRIITRTIKKSSEKKGNKTRAHLWIACCEIMRCKTYANVNICGTCACLRHSVLTADSQVLFLLRHVLTTKIFPPYASGRAVIFDFLLPNPDPQAHFASPTKIVQIILVLYLNIFIASLHILFSLKTVLN